ncbi:MAG: hypothetical protein U0835_25140 [Isosphaeraceae bacterium]
MTISITRRLACLALVPAACAGLSAGRAEAQNRPAPAASAPRSQAARFDVTRFGATPDPTFDSTAAFEAAARAAAAAVQAGGRDASAKIYVPASVQGFMITRPIHIADGVEIEGEGWSSKVSMYPAYRHPMFVFGVDAVRVTPADRPDLFGVLDAAAAPSSGVRRGVSTAGGKFLQLQFHDLTLGRRQEIRGVSGNDYWELTDRLTIDLGLMPVPGKPWPASKPLLGLGDVTNPTRVSPWFLRTGDRPDELVLHVADERFDDEFDMATHDWRISLAGIRPPYRLSFQVNLKDGRFAAYVNGVQVEHRVGGGGLNYAARKFGPGHRLRRNEDDPLVIGAEGGAAAANQFDPTPLTVFGLHVSARERYEVRSPGTAQRRAGDPRAAVDDRFRFFERSEADVTVGYLPLDDMKTTWTVDVHDQTGTPGSAIWMKTGQGGLWPSRVKELKLASRGPCLLLGAVLNFEIDHVRAQSYESTPVGSWRIVANYPVTLESCYLSGYDSGYYGFRQTLWANNTTIHQCGRDAWRLRGSNSSITRSFYGFITPWTERIFTFLPDMAGGIHTVTDAIIDTESGGMGRAVVEAWAHPTASTVLTFRQLRVAATGRTKGAVPVFKLHDHAVDTSYEGPSVIDVRNVLTGNDQDAVVSVDGPNWLGTVFAPQVRTGVIVRYTGPPGTSSPIADISRPK